MNSKKLYCIYFFEEYGSLLISVLVLLLFFIRFHPCNATNYYIKNGGNDGLTGLSDAQAWATISKVNGSTFSAGDTVFFNKGNRWFEYLIIPSSGTSGNHITFTSYGTGAKPKLYGSIPATSFTEHPSYSNVYRINEFIDYNLYYGIQGSSAMASIWVKTNGNIEWGDGYTMMETSFAGLDENYEWYWRNDSLYFFYNGTIGDIDTIEVPQLGRGIDVTEEYITIDGLDLKFFGGRCIGTSNYPEVTMSGLQIRNCHLAYTAAREDAVGYGIALAFSDMIIENNEIHDNGRRNISVNLVATTGNATMRDVIIQNNHLYNGYHTTGVDMSIHSSGHVVRNIIIRNNIIEDPFDGDPMDWESESIFLQNFEGVALEENYDSIFMYNNVCANITLDALYTERQGDHIYFVNNTCTSLKTTGARAFVFSGATTPKWTIMNNIFANFSTSSMESLDGPSDLTAVLDTCDYNLHYSNSNHATALIWNDMYVGDLTYNQFATIQGLGFDLNSTSTLAPCFVDSSADWRLKSFSSAIGGGTPVSFVTTDILGNERDPLTPTIGAYEGAAGESSQNNITSFAISGQEGSTTINNINHTVTLTMPYGTDVTNLTPTITVSAYATIDPLSGVSQNFTNPVVYTVTAEDLSTQEWTVTVSLGEAPVQEGTHNFILSPNGHPIIENGKIIIL